VAEPYEHARIVRRGITPVGSRAPPQRRAVFANDLDARPEHVALRARAHQLQADPVVPAPDGVHQQANRSVDVADDHVDVAVVVDVAESRSATDVEHLEHGARVPGDVLESSVTEIPEQEL